MRHGVFALSVICMFFINCFKTSVGQMVPRGPYFSFGPIVGFSFTKTPRSRDINDNGIGYTRYDKVGHSFNAGFIGNIFYKLSKERIIGLQLCVSSSKLKGMDVPVPSSMLTSTAEVDGSESETAVDDTEYERASKTDVEMIDNAKLRCTDLLAIFKYDVTWARTAISCGAGISKCNCTPSNRIMKTNLGYVINGSIYYDISTNVKFITGIRLRHYAKKEKFDSKNSSSLNNFNVETGLIMSF